MKVRIVPEKLNRLLTPVYSRTLEAVSSARTALEREFDPNKIRELKAGDESLALGGPSLTAADRAMN